MFSTSAGTSQPSQQPVLKGISSMATRQLLAELAGDYAQRTGCQLAIESVGGVDAARRVQAGEPFDVVFLASDAIDKLVSSGRIQASSKADLARSGVAVAVRAGAGLPDISSEAAVRDAVLAAPSISYSTGPSGVALAALFVRWGIADKVQGRLVQAPPGVPVGTLVARGEVALGFQQRSELLGLPGITLVGDLPPEIQITTTFSAGVCVGCTQPQAAHDLLAFLCSAQAESAKHRQGMAPA